MLNHTVIDQSDYNNCFGLSQSMQSMQSIQNIQSIQRVVPHFPNSRFPEDVPMGNGKRYPLGFEPLIHWETSSGNRFLTVQSIQNVQSMQMYPYYTNVSKVYKFLGRVKQFLIRG